MAVKKNTKTKTRTVNKSAKTGKIVSNDEAKANPNETFKQTVKASDGILALSKEDFSTSLTSETPTTDMDGFISDQSLPCLTKRPNRASDYTCLDELQEVVDNPQKFTEAQTDDIINENNLCENCRKNMEAE